MKGSKTQIQLYMISSVQNLKRLLGHFSQQFSEILSSLMQLEVIKIKISIASSFLTSKFIKNQNQNWLNSIIRRVYQQAALFIEHDFDCWFLRVYVIPVPLESWPRKYYELYINLVCISKNCCRITSFYTWRFRIEVLFIIL